MAQVTRAPLTACRLALAHGFSFVNPTADLDEKYYVNDAVQNLVDGVQIDDFEVDLRQGDGNEMENKFRAAHSSSALAVNNFAPFKASPTALKLPGGYGFTALNFERKCPHGLVGRKPPNLDVLADGPNGIVAVESKCLEYFSSHKAEFSPAYERAIRDQRRGTPWFQEMLHLVEEPRAYRWLDAAQLVKHAFGIAYTFPESPATLLYLYWEPSNADSNPFFAEHRAEVNRFAKSIAGGGPNFVSMSYPELWTLWDTGNEVAWIADHVGRLRARYGVPV